MPSYISLEKGTCLPAQCKYSHIDCQNEQLMLVMLMFNSIKKLTKLNSDAAQSKN